MRKEERPWYVPECRKPARLEQSTTREKFSRVLDASFLRGKFCRALNASFLIDMGASRLRRSVSPDSLPHWSRTATLPYLWRKELLPKLGGLPCERICVHPLLFLLCSYGLPIPLCFPNLYHWQNHLVGEDVTVKIQIPGPFTQTH